MNNVTVTKGRKPISARPMTPAERKARQRQKDRRAVIESIGAEENAPLKALLAQVARADQARRNNNNLIKSSFDVFG